MAIPATDLPINSVIVFGRVSKNKGHDHNCSDTLVFLELFPSELCKKKIPDIFFSAVQVIT